MSSSIAYVTVSGVTMVTSLAGAILSFKWAKTHGDPVRKGFRLVPVALVSQFIGSLLEFAIYAHSLSRSARYRYGGAFYSSTPLDIHSRRTLYVSSFFSSFSMIALFVALIDVSIGIRIMLGSKPKRTSCQKWTAKIMGVIMTLFAFANVVGGCLSVEWMYRGALSTIGLAYRMLAFHIMALIMQAMLFIGFTWTLVLAVKVSRRVKKSRYDSPPLGGNRIFSLYYAAVGVIWFSALFWIAYIITNYTVPFLDVSGGGYVALLAMALTYNILASICPTISLILLVVISHRNGGGLWTGSDPSTQNKMTRSHGHDHRAQSHFV